VINYLKYLWLSISLSIIALKYKCNIWTVTLYMCACVRVYVCVCVYIYTHNYVCTFSRFYSIYSESCCVNYAANCLYQGRGASDNNISWGRRATLRLGKNDCRRGSCWNYFFDYGWLQRIRFPEASSTRILREGTKWENPWGDEWDEIGRLRNG